MANIKRHLGVTQSDLEIVNICISKGKFKEALTTLNNLTQTHPNDANLFLLGGNCYSAMRHSDQAILCYEEAIRIKPDFAEAHNNIGFQLGIEKKESNKAHSYLKRAIKIKPDFAEAHNNLGICLYDLRKPEEAISCHKKAIKIKPDFAEAHINLGNVLRVINKPDEAILSYKRAIKIRPDYQLALDSLNKLLIELGRLDEKNFKEHSTSLVQNKDFEQGLLMLEKKNFTEAIQYFKVSRFGMWQEKVLECHYRNKEFDKFKQKFPDTINNKRHDSAELAILSAHYAQNFKTKDLYNFCPSPLNFVSHQQVPELMENNQNLIKELISDINTSEILKRVTKRANDSPVEQSAGNLFKRPEKSFHKLSDALIKIITSYFLQHQDEDNEFIRSFPKDITFSSAWYVKMQSGGHLSSHIHEDGWISGAVYLAIPKDNGADGEEGAIELSSDGDGYPRLHDEFEKQVILPKEGEVIFFPHTLFHRTIPFNSNEERICIAFDVQPQIN